MKKISFYLMVTVILSLPILYSCGGSSKNESPNKKAIITSTDWKISAGKITASTGNPLFDAALAAQGASSIDIVSSMDNCEKDDYYQFKADGKAFIVDAGTKCDPTSAVEGTWSLSSDETKFSFDFPTEEEEIEDPIFEAVFEGYSNLLKDMTIKNINSTTLELSKSGVKTKSVNLFVYEGPLTLGFEIKFVKK
jgi:hypothetical protein